MAGVGIDPSSLPVYRGIILPGQTIRNVQITHPVDLSGLLNVTLDRVWLHPTSPATNALVIGRGDVISNSTIDGSTSGDRVQTGVFGDGASNYVLTNDLVEHVTVGVWLDGDGAGSMNHTYVLADVSTGEGHVDGFTRRGGTGKLTIDDCRFVANVPLHTTGAFFLQDTWGQTIGGVSLTNSLLEGIGYLMSLDNEGSGVSVAASNVRFNLTTANYYGDTSNFGTVITYTGWADMYDYNPADAGSGPQRQPAPWAAGSAVGEP